MNKMPVPPAIAKIAPDGNLTPRQTRRFLIELGLRKQKSGSGSALAFLGQRTAWQKWPDLRPILQGIDWAVIGCVATRAYMAERTTQDLDILVRRVDGTRAIEQLKKAGYGVVAKRRPAGYVTRAPDGVTVDVLFGNFTWLDAAFAELGRDPMGYPVLSLPYLIVMKLTATRIIDWSDVPQMVGDLSDTELDAVRQAVARYSPEDSEDLEALIFLGRKEYETPTDSDDA